MDAQTPEAVAFELFERIAYVEKRDVKAPANPNAPSNKTPADRKWILDTYAECLKAAAGKRDIP